MSPADRALRLLDTEDSFAAVESLAACPDPADAAAAYDELETAMHMFAQAQHHAAQAGASDDQYLAQGFRCITQLLEGGDNDEARRELTRIVNGLAVTDQGREFAKQLETALRVFCGKGVPGGPP